MDGCEILHQMISWFIPLFIRFQLSTMRHEHFRSWYFRSIPLELNKNDLMVLTHSKKTPQLGRTQHEREGRRKVPSVTHLKGEPIFNENIRYCIGCFDKNLSATSDFFAGKSPYLQSYHHVSRQFNTYD